LSHILRCGSHGLKAELLYERFEFIKFTDEFHVDEIQEQASHTCSIGRWEFFCISEDSL
jgi:hypothetical protein